jgi:hypothetical protein
VRELARIVVCTGTLVLGGCAATVVKESTSSSLGVPPEARKAIVLNITGSSNSTTAKDWESFRGEWRDAMKDAAAAAGVGYSFQDGEAKATGEAGTLVAVYVDDYRYLSTGLRFAVGIMAGNAYVESKARFVDLKSGTVFGERTYNTTSHTIEGVFSAMTRKQLEAICKEVLADMTEQSLNH